ncbi:MAG: Sec-independent protein translocase subunit TatA/TatB [Bacteroidia bacterium]
MKPIFLIFDFLGGGELFVIVLAIMLLFGGKGMPNLMRNLGKGIRQFKDATNGIQQDIHDNMNTMKEEIKKQTNVIEEKTKHTDEL